ncbi:MAG: BatD family protein, partial [Planctomycetes bacterium]|nr:BatD family protein [Planctomycetota bacterium]
MGSGSVVGNRRWARHGLPYFLGVLATSLVGFVPARAAAQSARVSVEPAPYYAGVPVQMKVSSQGFSGKPECSATAPDGTALVQRGISQQFYSGASGANYAFEWTYYFVAPEPGTYSIGPFEVRAGSVTRKTQAVPLEVQAVPTDENIEVRLDLPDKPITLGQRVPVAIEILCRKDYLANIEQQYTLTVPLFDQPEFDFTEPDPRQSRGQIKLNGSLILGVTVTAFDRNGQEWRRIRGERTLAAKRPGEIRVPPSTLNTVRVTRWRRDFFDRRVPAATAPIGARDIERSIVVRDLPPGRPESFAGAIGQGFNIDVTADRTVVQAGDPIKLTIRIRGDGNLEEASLPPLSADGGISPELFKLPTGDITGHVEDGAKSFEVTVRPKSEQVRNIAPIAYSWFDPETGRFETTRSRPIALSVKAGNIVGAADVVGGEEPSAPDTPDPKSGETSRAATVTRPSFTLSGADLAVVEEVDRLLPGRSWSRTGTTIALYGVPVFAMLLAWIGRRRAAIDPAILRRRKIGRA